MRPLRTEDELWAWFRYMRNFDLTRLEERRQLIDVFVNTVFLYSDRFLLTLNFGYGSKTVLFTDIPCSDKVACGRPYRVFITDVRNTRYFFACVYLIFDCLEQIRLLFFICLVILRLGGIRLLLPAVSRACRCAWVRCSVDQYSRRSGNG